MRARVLFAALALLLASLVACGRSESLEPRARRASDAGAAPDVFVHLPPDAGAEPGMDAAGAGADAARPGLDAGRPDTGAPPWDAGTCLQVAPWKLEPRSVKSARVAAERFASPRLGSSVMLEVEVQLISSCDELARVDLVLMPGDATDFVSLNAFAWVQQGVACDPVAPVVTTSALVPGRGMGNLRVVVSDGHAPTNPLLLSYEVAHCASTDCWCSSWDPPGTVPEFSACGDDCDCVPGLACLPALSANGALWTCKRPCSKHSDCPESGCAFDNEYAPWVCGSLDACPYPQDCPAGFSCVIRDSPSYCEDQRTAPSVSACACDAECPPGQRCILGFRDTPTCEIPCADHQDCPFDWLVCGTPAFCVPLAD